MLQQALAMSMEPASGSAAVADAAMAEASAVDPDLALGVSFSLFSVFVMYNSFRTNKEIANPCYRMLIHSIRILLKISPCILSA